MAYEFTLPKLSEGTDEGVVVVWFKREGSHIKEGEPLLEVQMEKVSFEVEAPVSGRLEEILADKDDIVATDQVIARIEIEAAEEPADEETPTPEGAQEEPSKRILASPKAKRIAREHDLDLATVEGTGHDGRITEEDVQRAIDAQAAEGEEETERIPIRGMRATIARRMQDSLQNAAQLTLFTEIDVTALSERRQALKQEFDISYTDLILKAVALTLKEHPLLNATATEDEIILHSEVNIGLAVSLDAGLQVPVIRNVDILSLEEVSEATSAAAKRARAGTLTEADLQDGTFSVTNLGTYDVDGFTPIINPPQVAILGVGRIVSRLAMEMGEVVEQSMMTLSLTFDHRVVDGAPAAAFLQDLKGRLETPDWLK